jgi:hypothetical protein
MTSPQTRKPEAQIKMPGMPAPQAPRMVANPARVTPGQVVQYLGHVNGGPRFGVEGTVVQTLKRKAIVDLGRCGKWHIPYYFLTIPEAA